MTDAPEAMTRLALLRGINLGKRNVKSAELRAIFEGLGFDDVATFLASGNVAFRAGADGPEGTDESALARRIEAGLAEALGYHVTTFLRTCAELAEAASPARLAASPLAGEGGVKVHVLFLAGEVPADLEAAAGSLRSDDDDFLARGRELYWLRRGRMSDSAAWAPLEKAIAGRGTMRTLNTVERLLAKFCD